MEKKAGMTKITTIPKLAGIGVAAVLLLAACGSDDDSSDAAATDEGGETTAANACPVDGCTITITEVAVADDELEITWESNFDPDVARNHIHVYWNTFDPEQVSNDAETTHSVEQGDWVPTDANPTFVTEGAVSTEVRGDATEVCVTAADLDHNVLDVSIENCRDISELL